MLHLKKTRSRARAITSEKEDILIALVQAGNMSVKQICNTAGISRAVYYDRALNKLLVILMTAATH